MNPEQTHNIIDNSQPSPTSQTHTTTDVQTNIPTHPQSSHPQLPHPNPRTNLTANDTPHSLPQLPRQNNAWGDHMSVIPPKEIPTTLRIVFKNA